MISPLGVDRYSMPFFAEPHPDTPIECLPGCQDEQHPAKYPATTCAEFLLSRFADTYALNLTLRLSDISEVVG
ncbi:hypothetical protein AB4142_36945, partial [Variovorax sp. 2RAF20]